MSSDFDSKMKGDVDPFPGSFAETISGAQGGPTFGVLGNVSDMLPTHPQTGSARAGQQVQWSVRYRQFDLSDEDDVAALESILTEIANDPLQMLRQERLANDKEGFTIVTISWAVGSVVKPPKPKELRLDKDGNPYKLQQQYPFPTIEDGAYPGGGDTVLGPPGGSVKEDTDA